MKVGIALLNWNTTPDTLECLASLERMRVQPWKIAVLDNASSPDSLRGLLRFTRRRKKVVVLREVRNTGFAVGNNIAIQNLLDSGADFVWVLNNDTVVDKDCLGALLGESRKVSGLGCMGAYIYRYPNPFEAWYSGAIYNPWTLSVRHDERYFTGDHSREVDSLTGCSMFFPRPALEKVGLFDPAYFAYSEDVDWCLRAKRAGLKLWYCPSAILGHKVSASFGKRKKRLLLGRTTASQHYLIHRNQFYVIRKNAQNPFQRITATLYWLLNSTLIFFASLLLLRFDKTQAILNATLHGLGDPLAEMAKKPNLLNGVRLGN
jgi:GT2 family glycosyltransferase